MQADGCSSDDKTRLIIPLAILSAKPSGSCDNLRREAERRDLLPAVTNRLREGVALSQFVDQPGFLEAEMEFLIEPVHGLSAEVVLLASPVYVVFQIGKLASGREKGVEVACGVRPVVRCLMKLGLEAPPKPGALDQRKEPSDRGQGFGGSKNTVGEQGKDSGGW